MSAAKPSVPTLFFALQPDAAALSATGELVKAMRKGHGLTAKPLPADRLHVSLHFVGYDDEQLIAQAMRAGAALKLAPFAVSFPHVLSFKKPGKRPFVLTGEKGSALKLMHAALGAEMKRVGLGATVSKRFTPHVTLLYDETGVAETDVTPVAWQVQEFVLIRSHVGLGRHEVLGRWGLSG